MGAVYRSGLGSRVVMRDGVRELHVDGTFASCYEPGPRHHRIGVGCPRRGNRCSSRASAAAPCCCWGWVEGARRGSCARWPPGRESSAWRSIPAWSGSPGAGSIWTPSASRWWWTMRAPTWSACRRRFDAVLEDVFIGTGRDAVKPEWLPEPGLARAAAPPGPARDPREQRPGRGPRRLGGDAPALLQRGADRGRGLRQPDLRGLLSRAHRQGAAPRGGGDSGAGADAAAPLLPQLLTRGRSCLRASARPRPGTAARCG